MSSGHLDSLRSARPPRWCTAEAPPPRPAYHEAADAYPAVPVRTWCRLYRLMQARGMLGDESALRMARFLCDTDAVARDGAIDDVPAMIAAYTARCRVSRQTAYTDLGRLIRRGLVRQVQAAAPGQRARYRLTCPVAMVAESMPGLPADLARSLPLPADPEPAPQADPEPEVETGAPGPPPDGSPGEPCERLDPSPLIREGTPPSPSGRRSRGPRPAAGRSWGEASHEERDQAAAIIAACRSDWAAQRGWAGVPGNAELTRVEQLAAIALRHATPGEVRQVLTWHVASADDLPKVLAWRLGRIIGAARSTARAVRTDEEGRRYAAMLAARAAGSAHPAPGSATAAMLDQLRARLGPSRLGPRPDHASVAAQQAAESRAARQAEETLPRSPAPCLAGSGRAAA